jgi:hypothetical protein
MSTVAAEIIQVEGFEVQFVGGESNHSEHQSCKGGELRHEQQR